MKEKIIEKLADLEWQKMCLKGETLERTSLSKRQIERLQEIYTKILAKMMVIEITEEIEKLKEKIKREQGKGNKVAIVCMTGDLALPSHIFFKIIKKKLKDRFNLNEKKIKLFVGLENEERIYKIKEKSSILNNEKLNNKKRRYQGKYIKGIDEVFIRDIDENLYPLDLMLYLQPDFWISNEEYFDKFGEYLRVSRKLKYGTFGKTIPVVIKYGDYDKYLPEGSKGKTKFLCYRNSMKNIKETKKNVELNSL